MPLHSYCCFNLQALFFEWFKLLHLGIGAICFLSVVISWAYEERELVSLAIQKWESKSQALKQE
jgi:hypothetical protein